MLWVCICTVHLTVCSYHVKYAFQSESALYICLNVKELLAWNRCNIWSFSDCNGTRTRNGTRTHNYLVRKWTLKHLAKLAKWLMLWVLICIVHLTVCSYHVLYAFQGESTVDIRGFKSCCSHLNFIYRACFKQGGPWNSCKYRLWIPSEMHMWYDENIQSNALYR